MVQVPVTSMEEKDSKLMENSKFIINELVLCYEPDPLKAKMLYDAKVLDVDITKDDKSRKVYEYYIHFQGWNKSWDRWVLENQVLKINEVNRKLQTKFHDDAINKKKRKQKSSKRDSDDDDDKSVTSTGSGNSEDTRVSQRPLISLDIPKILAIRLEDDCYNIKRKKTLVHLPRKPSVNELFNEYYLHCEKVITTPEGRCLTNLNIVYEVLQGLNTYFNYYLFTLLLYNFEREQYNSLFSEFREGPCESSQASIDLASNDLNSKFPPTPNISESSSRSNSRTSSFCEDLASTATAPLLKEALRTKSVRKRKGEEKSQNADESYDCSSAKRSRKSSLSSPNSYARTPQQKTATREMRSSRSKTEEVFPKVEKAIKPMEILTENIIDYSRTTTRSRRYAPKGSPEDASKEYGKENEKDIGKDSGKEGRKNLGKVVSPPDSTKIEPNRDSTIETPQDFSKTQASRESSKNETPRHSSKTKTAGEPNNKVFEEMNEETKENPAHEVRRKSCARQLTIDVETECDVRGLGHKECEDIDNSVQNGNGCGKETDKEKGREAEKAKEEDLLEVTSKVAEMRKDSVNKDEEKPVPDKDVTPPDIDDEKKDTDETLFSQSRNEEENKEIIPKELTKGSKMEIRLEDVIVGTKRDSKKERQCEGQNEVTETKENKNEEQFPDYASSENGKCEKTFDISSTCVTDSNGNRLRRSVRSVKSTTVSESDEHEVLPMGSTARTFQASYNYDQKTSAQNKQNNSETFMMFPLLENSDTPADLYGFEHLLRLFVKLPILLASTNINEPKVTIILKIVRHLLEYLSKRSDLFVDMATIYSESII